MRTGDVRVTAVAVGCGVDCAAGGALSVPQPVARAPWVLLLAYEDGGSTVSEFRPNQRLAVTIPTVDPHHGKLLGLAVQLPTLARDSDGNEFPLPHAEWSVRTVWP